MAGKQRAGSLRVRRPEDTQPGELSKASKGTKAIPSRPEHPEGREPALG